MQNHTSLKQYDLKDTSQIIEEIKHNKENQHCFVNCNKQERKKATDVTTEA